MWSDGTAAISEQLAPGEHLLWTGRPRQGVRLRAGDMVAIPVSLLWAGFAVFWEWSAIQGDAPLFFRLWGVPFVLLGVYIVIGRFFWDAYQRARTHYAVSDQRVIIVTQGPGGKVNSLDLRSLSDITFAGSSTGPGVIQFGPTSSGFASWFANSGWPGMHLIPVLELADEAKWVYELIRQAQQKAG